jgi:SAM-dependent methyltransferase
MIKTCATLTERVVACYIPITIPTAKASYQEASVFPRGVQFDLRYLMGQAPWNTGVTPPEVKAFVEARDAPPGRALDLGCGTGKNTVYLARHGWETVGVDISRIAILRARWRAFTADAHCQFYRADVTDLHFLKDPFDLALDIGCLHSLPPEDREPYASEIARLTRPRGWYMLYAFTPRPAGAPARGIAPDSVEALFGPAFCIERQEGGEDPTGPSSAWYWLRRTTREPDSDSDE